MPRTRRINSMTLPGLCCLFLFVLSTVQAADFPLPALPPTETVFSRLIIVNRCYGDVKVVTENLKQAKPRAIRARNTERFELWTGKRTPGYTYTLKRDNAPPLAITLEALVDASQKSGKQLGDLSYIDHTYTLCAGEAELDARDAEFARPAKKGEKIDVFRIYLTQVPGSRDKTFAYTHYPIKFFLDNYPVFTTRSDDQGHAEIQLYKGTQGRLAIEGPAFRKNTGRQLYSEWAPVKTFTAKGGEMVYRIPTQVNPGGW